MIAWLKKKLIGSYMRKLLVSTSVFMALNVSCISSAQDIEDERFISHSVNLKKQQLAFHLKDSSGINYGNFQKLKTALDKRNEHLVFAMNGGMYLKNGTPQGLYIENSITKTKIDTIQNAFGNFYLQPNGIFYITENGQAFVSETSTFESRPEITYATQSGPMLVIEGNIHPAFVKGSKNLHIRNGVGILPNGFALFAMSKDVINLYDFAEYFKSLGCKNALYLDGFVSRVYLPEKNWEQLDGQFGVIIAEIEQ